MKQISVPILGLDEVVLYNLTLEERSVQRAAFAAADLMQRSGHFNYPHVSHRPAHEAGILAVVSLDLVEEFVRDGRPAIEAVIVQRPFDRSIIEIHQIGNYNLSYFSFPGPTMVWSPTGMIIRDKRLETKQIPRVLLLEE